MGFALLSGSLPHQHPPFFSFPFTSLLFFILIFHSRPAHPTDCEVDVGVPSDKHDANERDRDINLLSYGFKWTILYPYSITTRKETPPETTNFVPSFFHILVEVIVLRL